MLQKREGDIAQGKTPGIYYDKVKFDRIAELYLTNYKLKERKTLVKAERCARYLKEAFDGLSVTDITSDQVTSYIQERQDKGRLMEQSTESFQL